MRIRLVLLVVLLAGLAAGWQAETRAGLQQRLLLRSLTAQLAPFGALSTGQSTAHFWGSGEITALRFTPGDTLRARYALPPDFALNIPSLRYSDWHKGEHWPAQVRLRFDTATLPLAEPWPQSYSGRLTWAYRDTDGSLRLAMTLAAANAADIDGTLSLRLATPGRLSGATLLAGQLRYRDLGLVQGQRAALAWRLGGDPQNADHALAERLGQWLQQHGLPATPAQSLALSRFAAAPATLTVQLDPPGALRPETLPQFAPADRAAALGLSMEAR